MAAHDQTGWTGAGHRGFPFSPSALRGLRAGAGSQAQRLARARVTDGHIPDGPAAAQEARLAGVPAAASGLVHSARGDAWMGALPLSPRPYAQRPVMRQSGLRLMPLEGFVWGGRGAAPQPRTRADHTLIWVTGGRLQLHYPRQHHVQPAGELRFILAGTAFATLPDSQLRGHVLLIAPALVAGTKPPFPDRSFHGRIDAAAPALLATLTLLASEAQRSEEARDLAPHLALLALQLSRLAPGAAPHPPAADTAPDRSLLTRFLDLAQRNLATGRTIADLAGDLATTTAELDRTCLAARGHRAIDAMQRLRLDQGFAMLRQTRLPPAQIARQLGFTSLAHFTRAVVEATGRLPETYRQQYGGAQSDVSLS